MSWLSYLNDCVAVTGEFRRCDRRSPSVFRQTLTSTTPSPSATSVSRTSGTRASTPRRSSTTRAAGEAEGADDALQAPARDRRAGDDGEHHHRDQGQAVGILPRHDPAALGRGPARDDGRGRLRRARRRLDQGPHHAQLVAAAQHRMHADRTARRALLHRAGPDDEDRQALRMGSRASNRASR